MPTELDLKGNLEKFGGALNVLGRPLGAKEIYCINYIDNIVYAYDDRKRAENWAEWTSNNKDMAQVLNKAQRIAEAFDNGEDPIRD